MRRPPKTVRLTSRQTAVLVLLTTKDWWTFSEVGKAAGITRSAAYRAVRVLEASGWVALEAGKSGTLRARVAQQKVTG
jgi:DNA-binding IclR family transcriptional regulator